MCGDGWKLVDRQIAFAVDRRLRDPEELANSHRARGKTPAHHRLQDQSIEGVCTENLNTGVVVVKSAQDGA